jgi:hypothetical protein
MRVYQRPACAYSPIEFKRIEEISLLLILQWRWNLPHILTGLILAVGTPQQPVWGWLDNPERSWNGESMAAELNRLAEICDSLGLQRQAEISRGWLPNDRPDRQLFYIPEEVSVDTSSPHVDAWSKRFLQARERYADYLFSLAQQQALSGDEAASYRSVWQVVRENPQHSQALKILGSPVTAVSTKPRQRGSSPLTELPQAGTFQRWQSRHFEVYSRMNPKATGETVQAMEQFFVIWLQAFYELWAPPGLLTARTKGDSSAWPEFKRLQVVLFADRNEYVQSLGAVESNIEASTGYYNPSTRRCYFYYTGQQLETIYHELTHQLFAEIPRTRSSMPLDRASGAWAIEGIALYMESLKHHGYWWALGGIESPRLQTARYRAVRDGYWPNWQEFSTASIFDWKEEMDQIALFYSHAAGLAHLLMDLHPQKEASRQAFLEYLTDIYSGRSISRDLLLLLGADEDAAGQRYRELMTVTQEQLAWLEGYEHSISQLVLSRSQLEDWTPLRRFSSLEWLDLSFTNFTAQDVRLLAEWRDLKRLSLEGTGIDGQALPMLAELPQLVDLDLTGCKIDDDSLQALASHQSLEILWLTQTPVTNRVLETLSSLPKLRQCEISGTAITLEAWEEFLKDHPRIRASK